LDGTPLDTVNVPRREGETKLWRVVDRNGRTTMITVVPLQPSLWVAIEPEGRLLVGWTGEFRFVRSLDGQKSVHEFTRLWEPVAASEKFRRDTVESLIRDYSRGSDPAPYREAFRVEDVPSTFPAFASAAADEDGNVWVRHAAPAARAVRFSVFSPQGVWLGDVDVPRQNWNRVTWGRGTVAVLSPLESERPAVLRYTIVRPR
jgi:sugar lactone lactonase YvrE